MAYNIISYGAGTQSTALILMALNGEFNLPRPDFAVFSDTGGEPQFIYDYFNYFQAYCKEKYDFPIYLTKKNGIGIVDKLTGEQKQNREGKFYSSSVPPFFTLNADGTKGMLMRQCTGDYKTQPTNSFIKRMIEKKTPVNLWLGISFDERSRMKISSVPRFTNVYPLVDNFINRKTSIDYVKTQGIMMPQRSSCFFCPFHSDRYWKWLRNNHPDEFIKAIDFEKLVQLKQSENSVMKPKPFLHRACISLDKIDFDSDTQMDMFPELIDECDGYCGI